MRALFHTTEANSNIVALESVHEASATVSRQPKLAAFLFHFTHAFSENRIFIHAFSKNGHRTCNRVNCVNCMAIDFNHAFLKILVQILHTHLRV